MIQHGMVQYNIWHVKAIIRIPHSGPKDQDKGTPETRVCSNMLLLWSFGPVDLVSGPEMLQ